MELMLSKVFLWCLCAHFDATKQFLTNKVLDTASINFQTGAANALYSYRQNKPEFVGISTPFSKLVKRISRPWSRVIYTRAPTSTTALIPTSQPSLAETPPLTPDPPRTAAPNLAQTPSTTDSTADSTAASINASSQDLSVALSLAPTMAPFSKSPCNGTVLGVSVSGICDDRCLSPRVEVGSCVSGGSTGVCCVSVATTCGQTSSEKISYFLNPGFPEPYVVHPTFTFAMPTSCAFKITRSSPDVCLARIEYRSVKLDGHPPVCSNDMLLISAVVTGGQRLPHITCGTHTDVNAIAEFTHTNTIAMVVLPGQRVNADRVWNIRVTQIPNSCPSLEN